MTSRFIRVSQYTNLVRVAVASFVLVVSSCIQLSAAQMPRRRLRMILIVLLVIVAIAYFATPYVRAASLIVRVAGIGGLAQTVLGLQDNRVNTEPRHMVPTRHGAVPAQFYMPETISERAVLVMPGFN